MTAQHCHQCVLGNMTMDICISKFFFNIKTEFVSSWVFLKSSFILIKLFQGLCENQCFPKSNLPVCCNSVLRHTSSVPSCVCGGTETSRPTTPANSAISRKLVATTTSNAASTQVEYRNIFEFVIQTQVEARIHELEFSYCCYGHARKHSSLKTQTLCLLFLWSPRVVVLQ